MSETKEKLSTLKGHDDRGEGWGGRGRGRGGGNRGRNYDTRNAGGGSGGGRWQRGNGQKRRGRARGRGGGGGGGGPSPVSRLQDEDGDVAMEREGSGSSRSDRFNPYGRRDRVRPEFNRQKNRDSRGNAQGRGAQEIFTRAIGSVDATGGRNNRNGSRNDRRPRERTRDPSETWFKITIPYGKKQEKEWLLSAIRKVCTVPFQVVDYNYQQNSAYFYVDDEAAANALKSVSKRITAKSGHKVMILMSPSRPPRNQPILDEKCIQVLKENMSKRYDASKKLLSLDNMFHDPDLRANDIHAALNKPVFMSEVVKIIAENIPEISALNLSKNRLFSLQTLTMLVSKATDLKYLDLSDNNLKSSQDLDSIKGFKLEELLLRNNPFTNDLNANDNAEYISAVRQRFPKLLKLDGKDLPAPISFGIEEITALPPIQKSFFISNEIERVLSKFLDNYYSVFDSTDRQSLFNAYHEQVRFSLTAASSPYTKNILSQYFRESRNLLKVSDGSSRQKLLKQGRLATVAFLNELPQMQHDTLSFQIDVSLAAISTNPKILGFTVHGVFKDVEHKSSDQPLIAFSRFFITVVDPATGGLLIVNDELCVRPPTSNQKRAAFSSAAPTPSSSPVTVQPGSSSVVQVGLSADQHAMVQQFVLDSNMNAEWSMKCLQENNWNYSAAGEVFMHWKESGKIPPEAFVK